MIDVKRRLKIFIFLFAVITLTGTLGFMKLEGLSFFDALYYNIVTMSTVGYGDIHPTRLSTRLLAILIIVLGGGTFIGCIANATELMLLRQDKKQRMQKLHIVLGIFFSEIGYHLLKLFSSYDDTVESLREPFKLKTEWTPEQIRSLRQQLKNHPFQTNLTRVDFPALNTFLISKRMAIIKLLENPVNAEQEGFTDLLLAVAHLNEELESRPALDNLPEKDREHLTGDINRAYHLLVQEWLIYLEHIKKNYPYLYSLAVRKNPFNPDASTIFC